MLRLTLLAFVLATLPVLAGCRGSGTDVDASSVDASSDAASSGDASTGAASAVSSGPAYGEDFRDNACDYLGEDEVRSIFDIPAEAEVEVEQQSLPCAYKWHGPKPSDRPEIATDPEYTAGISYVVRVAEDERAAKKSFASMTRDRNQEATYEAVQDVGDEAAWESTHGSLVVRAGNLIFRTVASSIYYQGAPGSGKLVTEQHPEQAGEVARAVLK